MIGRFGIKNASSILKSQQKAFFNNSTKVNSQHKYEITRLAVEDLNNVSGFNKVKTDAVKDIKVELNDTKRGILSSKLPNITFNKNTTLGEIYDAFWTNYKYKGFVVFVGWSGLLYSLFWNPYTPVEEKEAAMKKATDLI